MDKETIDGIAKGFAFFWAFAIAAAAGTLNYLQRFAGEDPPPWKWLVFTVKGITAGGVGVLTHWLLAGWGFNPNFTYFAIAVAGWGGAETVVFFQQVFQDAIRRAAGASENDTPKS